MTFYLTFGQKSLLRDGYIKIEAPDLRAARRAAENYFENEWSMLYTEEDFQPKHFPRGQFSETISCGGWVKWD